MIIFDHLYTGVQRGKNVKFASPTRSWTYFIMCKLIDNLKIKDADFLIMITARENQRDFCSISLSFIHLILVILLLVQLERIHDSNDSDL